MKINAEKIIELCKDAPVIKPQCHYYAMADINPGDKAHIEFPDMDLYVIAAKNVKRLIPNKDFAGYLMAVKTPGPVEGYSYLDYCGFYSSFTGLLFSDCNGDSNVRPLSDNGTIILHFLKDEYDDVMDSLLAAKYKNYALNPHQIKTDMSEFTSAKPNFTLKNGELVF